MEGGGAARLSAPCRLLMKLKRPEGRMLEYKREWCDAAQKTMIAFANDLGGILQIGVAGDGEVVGCDFDQVERSVRSFARDGVDPSMSGLVQVRKQLLDDKVVAGVLIAPGTERPYSFRGKVLTEGGVYIRLGGQTVSATLDEVMRIIRRGDPRTWESRPCNQSDLTFDDCKRIFDEHGVPFAEANWLGYGLLNREREFTNLALLLSDQNPFRVIINKYAASGKADSSSRISGSVVQQWHVVRDRLREVNVPIIDKAPSDFARQEEFPWPQIALREALTNTLAHRDYTSPLQVAINIHPDVINFLTPGGIPPELTLEDALAEGASFCRNEKLAELFMRLHWMEKSGTGFGDIFRAYAEYDQKPRLKHIGRSFQIELPRVVNAHRSGREADVIRFIRQSPEGRSRAEIETYLELSRPTVMKILNALRADGQIVRSGKGRSVRYHAGEPEPAASDAAS